VGRVQSEDSQAFVLNTWEAGATVSQDKDGFLWPISRCEAPGHPRGGRKDLCVRSLEETAGLEVQESKCRWTRPELWGHPQ
jgi:hypothetical protein